MKLLKPFLLTLISVVSIHAATTPRSTKFNADQLLKDLKILSADDMEGRKPDTPGSAKARAYIVKRFKESGIKSFGDSYLQPFPFSFSKETAIHQGVNVVGYIPGTRYRDRYLIVTAHYDHLGIEDGKIYNGADDNASGTAGLFAVANYFTRHQPENSIIFCAFDAEENGRESGARAFLQQPPVKLESLVMNVNLDMICRDKNDILYAVGTYHYPYLKPFLQKASRSKIKLLFGHDVPSQKGVEDWTTESDHIHFHDRHIPFIYFGVEDNEQHHQPTDDYETITPGFYIAAVETIIDSVKEFDHNATEIQAQRAKTGTVLKHSFGSIVVRVRRLRSVEYRVGWVLTPGEFYELTKETLTVGSRNDFETLLIDESPMVRVLGLICLARSVPTAEFLAIAKPLYSDFREVTYTNGCFSQHGTVGSIAQLLAEGRFFLTKD